MLRAIGGDFIVGSEFVRRICNFGGGGLTSRARGGEGVFGGSGRSRFGGGALNGTWSRPAFGGAFLATIGAASRPAGGGGLPLGNMALSLSALSLSEYVTL